MTIRPLPRCFSRSVSLSFTLAAVATAAVLGTACADAQAQATAPIIVKLIGFNDFHGNLRSPGTFGQNSLVPFAQRPAVGGAEFIAAYVARLKAQNPLNVVVGAGDFIGASPLVSALFFDEPAVEVLNRIGLDFNSVGNHEFDKGSAELKRLQNGGCKITNGLPDPNSCKGLGSRAPGPSTALRSSGSRPTWSRTPPAARCSRRTASRASPA